MQYWSFFYLNLVTESLSSLSPAAAQTRCCVFYLYVSVSPYTSGTNKGYCSQLQKVSFSPILEFPKASEKTHSFWLELFNMK